MGKVYRPTISEKLFERFCSEMNIPFKRILEDKVQTPDYDIILSQHLVVAEIKQFDINDVDQEVIEQIKQNGIASHEGGYANRVRNKINSAKNQLKLRAQNDNPALLVLYDNVPTRTVNAIDIKQAMYGQEIDVIGFSKDWQVLSVVEVFGEKPKFTKTENTTFSAIALLEMDNPYLYLSFFHNYYARQPINPDWIRAKNIKHFSIDPISREGLKEWVEI
jgi:hypothetical protein